MGSTITRIGGSSGIAPAAPGAGGTSVGVGSGYGGPGTEISRVQDPDVRFGELIAYAGDCRVKGFYYEATQALNIAEGLARQPAQQASLRSARDQLDLVGKEWLEKYRTAYDQRRYLEALSGLGLLRRTFGALPSSIEAKKLLDRAETDAAVRTVLQEVKARELDEAIDAIVDCSCIYEGIPEAASQPVSESQPIRKYPNESRIAHIRKLSIEKQAKAVSTLERIGQLYPQSPTGKVAAADLKTLQADKPFWDGVQAHVSEVKAQGLFSAAQMYQQAGNIEKAIQYYEDLVARYPKSPLVAKAKTALIELK